MDSGGRDRSWFGVVEVKLIELNMDEFGPSRFLYRRFQTMIGRHLCQGRALALPRPT